MKKLFLLITLLFLSMSLGYSNSYSYYNNNYNYEYNYNNDYNTYHGEYNRNYYNNNHYYNNYSYKKRSNINKYKSKINNRHNYNKSCYNWNYAWFRYPTLRNWYTYNSTKDITSWVQSAILRCNNWKISMKSRKMYCNYWYQRVWSYCKRKVTRHYHNSSCEHNYNNNNSYNNYNNYNNKSCYSWTYAWYDYPKLNNWKSYNIRQSIVWGIRNITIKCSNWTIKQTKSKTYCISGYYKNWNYCKYDWWEYNYYY